MIPVNPLAQRLLSHVRQHELLRAGDRVGVAVSGGIDSVALLRLLLELRGELGIVVSVVHFNHKLRGAESDGDEQFVAELARQHGIEFLCDGDDVAGFAREHGVSLETAARELRYGFFRHLIREGSQGLKPQVQQKGALRGPEGPLFREDPDATNHGNAGVKSPTLSQTARQGRGTPVYSSLRLDKILTGHTLDDQAETVLMRIIRGSGLRGLGGIHPRIAVEGDDGELCGEIVRPVLVIRRRELEHYLDQIGQSWREDATNADDHFTRNRVRKLLVPLLESEFNPSVTENLAELAEIARGEEDYWDNEVAGWMGTGVHWSEPEWAKAAHGLVQIVSASAAAVSNASGSQRAELQRRIDSVPWLVMNALIDRVWLLGEPVAVQRRIIKAVGEEARIPLEFKHVEEILEFASEEGGGKSLSLPLGWTVRRDAHEVLFVTPDLREAAPAQDYDYELLVPGRIEVVEAGLVIECRRVSAEQAGEYNPDQLLDADSLPGQLHVRNWRAGDRFWPGHSKSPKKIKELLQERHVTQPERRLWPVAAAGDQVVWLRGFGTASRSRAKAGREAVAIVERALTQPH